LIDAYNRQKRIWGVRQQLLYLIALDKVIMKDLVKVQSVMRIAEILLLSIPLCKCFSGENISG